MEQDFIPTQPEFVTKDWLFLVINQYRNVQDLSLLRSPEEIKEVETLPHPLSRNQLSSSYLVRVTYSCNTSMGRESFESRLYLKLAARVGPGLEARLLEREVETMMRLFPRVQKLVKESQVTLALPEIVFGAHSLTGEGALVTQNLLHQGYTRPEPGPGLSLSSLVLVTEAVARIHAASAVLLAKADVRQEYPHLQQTIFEADGMDKTVQPLLKEFCGFIRRVPGLHSHWSRMDQWRQQAGHALCRQGAGQTGTVCLTHGALTKDNLLVSEDKVVLTDWKAAALDSPVSDIAFFLLSSSSRETRTEQTPHLLEIFHFTFCSTLVRLGVEPRQMFPQLSLENLVMEYKRSLFPALLRVILHLGPQIKGLEEQFKREGGEEVGEQLRQVGRRAVDLVDEAYLHSWGLRGSQGTCQTEGTSLTITLPSQTTALKG